MGSVVSHEFGPKNDLPPYVCVPTMPNVYAGTGYLSSSFSPFSLGSDPASGGLQGPGSEPPGRDRRLAVRHPSPRPRRRQRPLRQEGEGETAWPRWTRFIERAYSLISSPKAREAFNIDAEPAAIRDEYGRNAAGQRMLMARRLVAAGVRFVALQYGGWDLHAGIAGGMRQQMPAFDQAYAALIRDLDRTGLLDRTIVMVSSEFGRTPKINKDGGRDHWPKVFSIALAGGGIKKGLRLRRLELDGHRARTRPDRPRGPRHDPLPSDRDRRRQGIDGPRRPADRDRRRRQGPDRVAGLIGQAVRSWDEAWMLPGFVLGSSWEVSRWRPIILDRGLEKALIRERRETGSDRYDEVWNGVYVMSPDPDNNHQRIGLRLSIAFISATDGGQGCPSLPWLQCHRPTRRLDQELSLPRRGGLPSRKSGRR